MSLYPSRPQLLPLQRWQAAVPRSWGSSAIWGQWYFTPLCRNHQKRKVVSTDSWLLSCIFNMWSCPCLTELCVCMSELQWISFILTSVTAGSECVPASTHAGVFSHANMSYLNRRCFFPQSQILDAQKRPSYPQLTPEHMHCVLGLQWQAAGFFSPFFPNHFPLKLLNLLAGEKKKEKKTSANRRLQQKWLNLSGLWTVVGGDSYGGTRVILMKRRAATCVTANSSHTIVHIQIKARLRVLFIQ